MFTVKIITFDNQMTIYAASKVRVIRAEPNAVELFTAETDGFFARFEINEEPVTAIIVENAQGKTTEVVRA